MDRIGFDSEPVSGDHAMTSMREKIARVAAKAAGNFNYDGFGAETKAKYDRIADAVLDALMEPTEGMIGAFHHMCDDNGSCLVKPGYQAMILAAKEST
jgi:hypothetical protein